MTVTTTSPVSTGTSATGSGGDQKGFGEFLSGIIPDLAGTVAPSLGIDPRVAGQTVSQVLSIFGIGGPGKAFTPALPKEQAVSQLQQHGDPVSERPGLLDSAREMAAGRDRAGAGAQGGQGLPAVGRLEQELVQLTPSARSATQSSQSLGARSRRSACRSCPMWLQPSA